MKVEIWILLRLVISGLLGGLVGYERQASGKRAGLRTHMLVAMGSTLFVSSADMALEWSRTATPRGDVPSVLRVEIATLTTVQAIATGIGFLGAGTIFVGGRRHQVHGLTTAASIWMIAAIGVAIAWDHFVLASGAALLALVVLHVLVRFEPLQKKEEQPEPGGDMTGFE